LNEQEDPVNTQSFSFVDVYSGEQQTVEIAIELHGLCIKPQGTATFDGDFGPIFLEFQNGRPVLYVWPDVNKSADPVEIDLTKARKRK
jgi:hypothetical protein